MLPVLPFLTLLIPLAAPPADPGAETAERIFAEAEAQSEKDDGKLWKVFLAGPMMIVDPSTSQAWANEEILGWGRATKGVWSGTLEQLPPGPAFAFLGRYWAVLMLPAPIDEMERRREIARLLFRRLEPTLGLPSNRPPLEHLKKPEAARWLMLEAAALDRALRSSGPARKAALEDAIIFRVWRRAMWKPEAGNERILELNDGLAEYSAQVLTVGAGQRQQVALALLGSLRADHFAPAFGLAYGVLMDLKNKRWRDLLDAEVDLGLVLREVWGIKPPLVSRQEAERRAMRYKPG